MGPRESSTDKKRLAWRRRGPPGEQQRQKKAVENLEGEQTRPIRHFVLRDSMKRMRRGVVKMGREVPGQTKRAKK